MAEDSPTASAEDSSSPYVTHARLLLLSQYACRLSPRSCNFHLPPPRILLRTQPFLAEDLFGIRDDEVDAPQEEAASAETGYQKAVLKELISRIEDAIDVAVEQGAQRDDYEVDPLLLEHYAGLMAMPTTSAFSTGGLHGPMEKMSSTLPLASHAAPVERRLTYYYPQPASASNDSAGSGPVPSHDQSSRQKLLQGWGEIHLRETSALIGAGTTALKTWEAALRLAAHLLQCPDQSMLLAPGSRVLELGSGTGLLSTLVAKLQTQSHSQVTSAVQAGESAPAELPRVYATDLPSVVSGKLRETIELNGLSTASNLFLYELDWIEQRSKILAARSSFPASRDHAPTEHTDGHAEMTAIQPLAQIAPTLILGADIIFDPDIIPPLVETIKYGLTAGQARARRNSMDVMPQAIISSTVRNLATYSRFLALVDGAGLASEEIQLERCLAQPPYGADASQGAGGDLPPIAVFASGHEDEKEGVVRGLRIWLPDCNPQADSVTLRVTRDTVRATRRANLILS